VQPLGSLQVISRVYAHTYLIRFWLQFLKEQATLSAEELTAESVKDFVSEFSESDLEYIDDEQDGQSETEIFASSTTSEAQEVLNSRYRRALLSNGSVLQEAEVLETTDESIPAVNGTAVNGRPVNGVAVNGTAVKGIAVNGTQSKAVGEVLDKLAGVYINGTPRTSSSISNLRMMIDDEARAKFEAWQIGRVAMWHGSGDRSLQWLSIACVDRKRKSCPYLPALGSSGLMILVVQCWHMFGDVLQK
jgi:GTP pyrophosphokinase